MATHTRHTSTSKRPLPAHARPSKPAPLHKRNSYGATASKKAVPLHKKEEEIEDEEDLMATSFLQFCATCEKQIIVPCNSVLYCSESCRKKDTEKQFTFPSDHSPPLTPFFSQFSNFSLEDLHFRDIVPPRSPTQIRSNRSSCAFSELSSSSDNTDDNPQPRHDSDASRYLRQFHQSSSSHGTDTTIRAGPPRRPHYSRTSTSHIPFVSTFSAAPSLTHTPASSLSFSLPYTPSTRPLPPRTNPHSTSYGHKSIDLVTPLTSAPGSPRAAGYSLKSQAATATSASTIGGEIVYAKSPIMVGAGSGGGSLGRLLAGGER